MPCLCRAPSADAGAGKKVAGEEEEVMPRIPERKPKRKDKLDGYKLLREHPELAAAVERMAGVKIIFEEDEDGEDVRD